MGERLADLRALAAIGATVIAIIVIWHRIEARPVDDAAVIATTTTTTAALPTTTTTSPAQAVERTCERTDQFLAEAALIPSGAGPGPLARLALSYWSAVEMVAVAEAKIEITAVVTYYQSYLETAAPFGFNTAQIIVEGDKEKFEQLVTRPAPGLEASEAMVAFACGKDLPGQPSISAESFEELEDRLLDPS